MLYVSNFQPDPARMPEFIACLWQGELPTDLVLHKWLYLPTEPMSMHIIWEGDDEGAAYMQRAFGTYGTFDAQPALRDATGGLQAAFDRDLAAFGAWMAESGSTQEQIDHALDIRRRGIEAPDQASAAAAGRAWATES